MKTVIGLAGLAAGMLLCCSAAKKEEPMLGKVPEKTLREAEAFGNLRYDYQEPGEQRHTGAAWNGGSLVVQALAAYTGNENADAKLLEKYRNVLKAENAPLATGAYLAQHERLFTGSAVILKHTPGVWNKLTDGEKHKTDLIIKACLAGCAYTTSDANYGGGKRPFDMGGGDNFERGWNPNFREGMIGMLLTGACYLGPAEAQRFLDTYDHEAFCAELKAAGLSNPYRTFTWKKDHPDSDAPTGGMVEAALHGFRYLGKDITDPMGIYVGLTENTYGATVSAGLNDGAGEQGAGKIADGAEGLPNIGEPGMLKEFDSGDAGGARSSSGYAYDGFRPNLVNQIVLIVTGRWDPVRGKALVALLDVGIPDLYYKLEHGYLNYSKGKASRHPTKIDNPEHDFRIMRSLWEDVVRPYHGK